ncbi:hypothetical protein DM02DRAFT_726272 [Periconia macrospinosa]|uniref:ABM domain-containing protein n=1 Tax=Periconia macrospinosa TaxID=97972 RepID=A0A2V1E0B3_9PLEO|nr:hypothetical protein DM02DRAFT_726272 [Periconia macrospinosa]
MPVTELARLTLLPPNTLTTPLLISKLEKAKRAMETYTHRNFAYMVPCGQDPDSKEPATLYILGEWASVDQHLNDWIPSQENKELLEMLKDDVTVDWLIHVDAPREGMPFPVTDEGWKRLARDDVWFSVDKFVAGESNEGEERKGKEKDLFERVLERARVGYEGVVGRGDGVGGGWIVERTEKGGREFVLCAAWKGNGGSEGWEKWREGFKKDVDVMGGEVVGGESVRVRRLDI